ncbi:hypothetical protein [Hymenobacter cellulosilyticus]|uniref:Uncharacterized protein n=1 Tax=Hymenobacter cellulosilyticus TaxID=2932248 RepID=A0A8T9Q1S1_9BACT|nr:hypothetical protein [Hymenobacter cellulosilyticus]UOQ71696.1 hypothetical protein MUN79_24325 [Hymenobacter cellulosilyticus]
MQTFPEIISLASGYGNFAPPAAAVTQAAALLLAELPLSPIEGQAGLRAAIAARYQQQGATVAPEQVLVTPGAKPALFALFKAALQPGTKCCCRRPTGLASGAGGKGWRHAAHPAARPGHRLRLATRAAAGGPH